MADLSNECSIDNHRPFSTCFCFTITQDECCENSRAFLFIAMIYGVEFSRENNGEIKILFGFPSRQKKSLFWKSSSTNFSSKVLVCD